jgi:hypothetical protein
MGRFCIKEPNRVIVVQVRIKKRFYPRIFANQREFKAAKPKNSQRLVDKTWV